MSVLLKLGTALNILPPPPQLDVVWHPLSKDQGGIMGRPTEKVRIRIERRGNRFYVSSNDIEGLWLWGSDFEELMEDVAPAIKHLYKFNRGMDVEVKEGIVSRVVSWFLVRLFKAGRDRYKIYEIGSRHLTSAHG